MIGVGPGFRAPDEVDAVVESNRGHDLGRVIYEGEAEAYTGSPAPWRVRRGKGSFAPPMRAWSDRQEA